MRGPMLLAVTWCAMVVHVSGCGGGMIPAPTPIPTPACVSAPQASVAYVLNGFMSNSISMFTVNSCTGALATMTPPTAATGMNPENMVVDPQGRFL